MNWLLVALIGLPIAGALVTALGAGREPAAAQRLGLLWSALAFALGLPLIAGSSGLAWRAEWFGLPGTSAMIHFSLASDGLSGWLAQLVTVLTPVAILSSRGRVGANLREYVAAILTMQGLMLGALFARDLVVFYLFYEAMLIPMVVLIAAFGGPDRRGAAVQFFLFTMLGSVFMLVAIWVIAARLQTTELSTVLATLATRDALGDRAETFAFVAFCLAFAVKVPLVPLHGWQARTYAECPAGAAVLLAGVMAKIGIYGLLRFVLPMFPGLSATYAPVFIALGLVGVIGGALMAIAQTDVKRMLAYSSLSHLGLVVVGIFTFDPIALHGAAVQLVAHGLSVAALFVLVGAVEERADSGRRGLDDFGGLAGRAPRLAVLLTIATLASAALPGTANFVGEFQLLFGVFSLDAWWISAIAGLSTILGVVYLLRFLQRWLYGPESAGSAPVGDLVQREMVAVVPLLLLACFFGFYPRPIASQAGATAVTLAAGAAEAARKQTGRAPVRAAVQDAAKDAHAAR